MSGRVPGQRDPLPPVSPSATTSMPSSASSSAGSAADQRLVVDSRTLIMTRPDNGSSAQTLNPPSRCRAGFHPAAE